MDKVKLKRGKIVLFLSALLLCSMMFFLSPHAMFRDMWFDEAITVSNYATLPNISRIYHNYLIPNNHIVYTILLKYWIIFWRPWLGFTTVAFRLPAFICGFIALVTILLRWRRRLRLYPAFLTALCLSVSLPFAIYASAVRGYMLCFLLVLLAFDAAFRLRNSGKFIYGLLYFVTVFLAVGCVPSSLIAFLAMVIFFMGHTSPARYFMPRNLAIAAIPPLALVLFYLPISGMFVHSMSLREGWKSFGAMLLTLYSAFGIAFFPLIMLNSVVCWKSWFRTPIRWRRLVANLLVFLLPCLFFWRLPAPFLRVFFPLWAVWMVVIAYGTGDAMAIISRRYAVKRALPAAVLLMGAAIFGYGLMINRGRDYLSEKLVADHGLDDYFSPYYMRKSFAPTEVIKEIKKITRGNPLPTYISFNSSPYSFVLHGVMFGIDKGIWGFYNPQYKIRCLPPKSFAILSIKDDPRQFIKRFKVRHMTLIKDFGYHQLYYVEL